MTPQTVADASVYPASVQRVADALVGCGHAQGPLMLDAAARTAQQAADGLGVALGQIAKSIIFKRHPDGRHVLVITAGDRRVDEAKVAALVCDEGQRLGRADAEFVRERTGYAIGGVPPVAHAHAGLTLIDESLQRFDQVWAAAGHPHSVFALCPAELPVLTGAVFVDVAQKI
jgi:prolyl-tRNA editing enzyme YbaK/EbsC (Cys-tRNA(Pro) deacylase)